MLCNIVHHTARYIDCAEALGQQPQLGVQEVEPAVELSDRPVIEIIIIRHLAHPMQPKASLVVPFLLYHTARTI